MCNIPPNDKDNLYIIRDGNYFNLDSFDEPLAGKKLSTEEVYKIIDNLN